MWQASVGLNLPLRRTRRAAAVAEAEAAARAAEARVQSVELVLTQRTRERVAELDAARRTAALYAGGIVRQGESSVEAAQASYQTGRVPFVTVLEALNSLYADRGRLLDLREAQARLRVDLDEASLERGGAAMAPGAPAAAAQPAAADAPAMGSMSR
jgi:outer membrane protein TolC